ncbi:hypothetical protein FPZ43_00190 [Mucilaginibacter pallidiroseus]|uniref:CBS domain-containing protein n=1 Tax=Mucilaginibacter pallidiroseus TaxID=2599295 RepID=A0A563UHU2_9SPHI|nr:CBS domain-containing protein [Mucilaginibacter pallidiroseus]TWR30937.1 hypothetical protein FPZ43_00190 [Mucilaginibacter pallidiroseus]
MDIAAIITRDYTSVSILEDTRQVLQWLKVNEFLVVVDEDLKTVGLITPVDMIRETGYQLIDCAFHKPSVSPKNSLSEIFKLMQTASTPYLPVYNDVDFLGVISMEAVTVTLFNQLEQTKNLSLPDKGLQINNINLAVKV